MPSAEHRPERKPADANNSEGDPVLLSVGFRNLDAASEGERARHANCLQFIQSCKEFERVRLTAYKELALDSDCNRIVEIGCGLGLESIRLARTLESIAGVNPEASVVGTDLSETFIAEASQNYAIAENKPKIPVSFIAADVRNLSEFGVLNPGPVDRVYEERTLQHVPEADFAKALNEVSRVLDHGGRFVCVEPNWELFTIRGGDAEVARAFRTFWCDKFNHGRVGLNLESGLIAAGFSDVHYQLVPVEYRDFACADLVYDIRRSLQAMVEAGIISSDAQEKWISEQEKLSADGAFYCVLCMCVVSGQKP